MKTIEVGKVSNAANQTVTVRKRVGVCEKCGSFGVPINVQVQWGNLSPACDLTSDEAVRLSTLLLQAAANRPQGEADA